MYLTINPNSALDRVLFIEQFIPGGRMIPSKTIESVGGKGFDTAVVLRALELDTLTIGYVAGETGRTLAHLLERYGIRHDLIWVEGETRVALVIAETLHHRHSHIIYGSYTVPPEACDDFFTRFTHHVANAKWVIGAGSLPEGLPKDFYRRVIKIAAEHHVSVLIDCPGEPILQAIPAQPMIVKMNWQEFERTFQLSAATLQELADQAIRVRQAKQISNLVITCGEHGILALTSQGNFLALPPKQKAINAAGAGDAVSAALAWRLSLGDDWALALKWAAATGAAVVLTEGTADCRREDIDRLYPQTVIQELNGF